jgi:pyruvate-formate lyase-activating enzyme
MKAHTTFLRPIKFFAKRLLRAENLGPASGGLSPEQQTERIKYSKGIFPQGRMPTDFSITIGVAPCNYSCLFCPQSVSKPKKAVWLDLELLKKCVSEMPEDGLRIHMSSFSETIAAPNLVPAIRTIKQLRPKLKIAMATNGSLFREKVIEGLIDAGLDHYSYSFDAPTRETYVKLIQVDNFHKAWDNLQRVVDLRNRKGSKMIISTHIMHFKGIEKEFDEFKAAWQDKVDIVHLRTLGNWGGAGGLNLMGRLADLGFVPAHEAPAERFPCYSIFTHFQLQPDGHYMPCIGTTPDYASNSSYSLGHARETTWTEAWGRLGEMRQAHLHGDWGSIPACEGCNIWSLWKNGWIESARRGQKQYSLPGIEHPQ